jgi:cell division protein FtsL
MPLEIRFSLEKLLIILIVVLVPLNFIGLYLTTQCYNVVQQNTGALFRNIAENDAIATYRYLNDRVTSIAAIASQQVVVDAIQASNRERARFSPESRAAQITETENMWNTPQADTVASGILSSRASAGLRQDRELDQRFLKLLVLDENGVPVAATGKPAHYAPLDEAFWQAVFADGKGALYVTDVQYDRSNQTAYLDIGMPVFDEHSKRFIGAIRAFVDVSPLFSVLHRDQAGRTLATVLVREDGTVISAPNVDPSLHLKSEEYGAVRDALGTLQGRQAGYLVATLPGGSRLVGFADVGLTPVYPNLAWFVMVGQSEREALSSVRTLVYFAIFMVVVALLIVSLLTAYFYLHRKQEMADIEAPPEPVKEQEQDLVNH